MMPKYAGNYEELIDELYLQLEALTTERDELRAALKECREQAEADYISLQEDYLQYQKDVINERKELKETRAELQRLIAENIVLRTKCNELQAKLESGVRVNAWTRYSTIMAQTPGMGEDDTDCNATLILDDGVEI